MPQTVFDVGDLITSRLNLGVVPDGTTTVTLDVFRPDGTAIADPSQSAWVGMERTTQFYATNDGLAGSATSEADGDWVVVWNVAGTGASVSTKVYNVRTLPETATRPEWVPFLSDVADYIARLTIDVVTPGNEIPLGTFNGLTNPTDEQAHRLLDKAVAGITARLGTVTAPVELLARAVAAIRTAAWIARSFPRSNEDLATADALDRQADAELDVLIQVNSEYTAIGTADTLVPAYSFPDPVWWGDDDV